MESQGSGQKFEIIVSDIEILGECDSENFPIQPKKHSLEFLREKLIYEFAPIHLVQ